MFKVTQRYYDNGKVFAEVSEVHEGDDLTPFTECKKFDNILTFSQLMKKPENFMKKHKMHNN